MCIRDRNSACNYVVEVVDSITRLAPPWGSAVDFGGAKTRFRIAFSLGAVRQNRRLNSACNYVADAEFVDGITLLAPQWGSAIDFGGAKILLRIALSLGAVLQNRRLNSACNYVADAEFVDSIILLAPS